MRDRLLDAVTTAWQRMCGGSSRMKVGTVGSGVCPQCSRHELAGGWGSLGRDAGEAVHDGLPSTSRIRQESVDHRDQQCNGLQLCCVGWRERAEQGWALANGVHGMAFWLEPIQSHKTQ